MAHLRGRDKSRDVLIQCLLLNGKSSDLLNSQHDVPYSPFFHKVVEAKSNAAKGLNNCRKAFV
jgi:hypothetical protein